MQLTAEMDFTSAKINAQFGSRIQFLFHQVFVLAMTGLPFHTVQDQVTSPNSVRIRPEFIIKLSSYAEQGRMHAALGHIPLSDGTELDLAEIEEIIPVTT
ncbi:MAG: hypothetical protein ACOWWM_06670 [Desulfobacterales bacterium]